MKTASANMKAHLLGDLTKLARLYKITRKDGTVFTFTDHDRDIDTTANQDAAGLAGVSDGGHVYEAAMGISPSAIQGKSDLSADNQDVTVFIDSTVIREADIRFGVWDSAQVEIRLVNWSDLTMGEIKVRFGILGNLSMKNGVLTAEVLGLTNKLQILQGRSFGGPCDAELGDARCKATVPTESGSVDASADAHHITPHPGLTGAAGYYSAAATGSFATNNSSGVTAVSQNGTATIAATGTVMAVSAATRSGNQTFYTYVLQEGTPPKAGETVVITGMNDSVNNGTFTAGTVTPSGQSVWVPGYYDDGVLTFSAGVNSGLSFQIATWDGAQLRLHDALFAAPAYGDAFAISPGCAHNVADCKNKFNNLANHRGYPKIPGMDTVLLYPDAK